jgi:GTPase involved in cell partitioning and DNA repair
MLTGVADRVITAVATTAVLGALAFIWDINTTDSEVKPDVNALKASVVELKKQTKELSTVVDAAVVNQAQQTIRVTSKEIAALEAKPRRLWTEADKRLYEISNKQLDQSITQISTFKQESGQ